MIRSAKAGPTPGRRSSSAWEAVLRLMRLVEGVLVGAVVDVEVVLGVAAGLTAPACTFAGSKRVKIRGHNPMAPSTNTTRI